MVKKADVLQQKSPAEFFAENKNIAGFDNVRVTLMRSFSRWFAWHCLTEWRTTSGIPLWQLRKSPIALHSLLSS